MANFHQHDILFILISHNRLLKMQQQYNTLHDNLLSQLCSLLALHLQELHHIIIYYYVYNVQDSPKERSTFAPEVITWVLLPFAQNSCWISLAMLVFCFATYLFLRCVAATARCMIPVNKSYGVIVNDIHVRDVLSVLQMCIIMCLLRA